MDQGHIEYRIHQLHTLDPVGISIDTNAFRDFKACYLFHIEYEGHNDIWWSSSFVKQKIVDVIVMGYVLIWGKF